MLAFKNFSVTVKAIRIFLWIGTLINDENVTIRGTYQQWVVIINTLLIGGKFRILGKGQMK